MLNKTGPIIEPCRTPDIIYSKVLLILLTLTHCFVFNCNIYFCQIHKQLTWQLQGHGG